jgi:hypothetical protein
MLRPRHAVSDKKGEGGEAYMDFFPQRQGVVFQEGLCVFPAA